MPDVIDNEAPTDVFSVLAKSQPDRDVIVISQAISRQLHHELSKCVATQKVNDKCTVFLTTRGGDPDGGYRLARCLQHNYKHIRLVIPSLCKSAGTLVAIGAHELVIGDLGELGPLDIQVRKASELEERSSGLDIIQALEAAQMHARQAFHSTLVEIRRGSRLSTRLAGEFAANVAIGVTAPLYNQIDPNRLGEMQRAMRIAHEYGQRLNEHTKSLRSGALDILVAAYPSHSFVIDRKEAKKLFNRVEHPTAEEHKFCMALWDNVFGEQSDVGPFYVHPAVPNNLGEKNDDGTTQGSYEGEHQPNAAGGRHDDPHPAEPDEQGERVRQDGTDSADQQYQED
jgi:Serine dehydrogenase proteinase